jgi:hypothetical protein
MKKMTMRRNKITVTRKEEQKTKMVMTEEKTVHKKVSKNEDEYKKACHPSDFFHSSYLRFCDMRTMNT